MVEFINEKDDEKNSDYLISKYDIEGNFDVDFEYEYRLEY